MSKYVGKAKDGTRILTPTSKPKNFTRRQLQIAVRRAKLIRSITDENRHDEVKA